MPLLLAPLLLAATTTARPPSFIDFAKVALLTPSTLRSGALAIATPLLCERIGLVGKNFDPSLLSLIIATPSAFSINAAYARRQATLSSLAQYRAAVYMLQQEFARWAAPAEQARAARHLGALHACLETYLAGGDASVECELYAQLAGIGECLEAMRRNPTPASKEGIEPLATIFVSDERLLVQAVEQVRVVAATQTPFLLRAFTVGGSALFPVLFGPYFASVAAQPDVSQWAACLVSFLFACSSERYTRGLERADVRTLSDPPPAALRLLRDLSALRADPDADGPRPPPLRTRCAQSRRSSRCRRRSRTPSTAASTISTSNFSRRPSRRPARRERAICAPRCAGGHQGWGKGREGGLDKTGACNWLAIGRLVKQTAGDRDRDKTNCVRE